MNNRTAIILVVAILAVGLFLRALPSLMGQSALEPDNLIYLSMIKQAVSNGYKIPLINSLSGFPNHNLYGESPYLIAMPLFLVHYLGISPEGAMYLIMALFAVLGMYACFKLGKKLTGTTEWGLFAMFLFATLPVAIYKGYLIAWRGDSFTPILLGLAVVFLLDVFDKEGAIKIIGLIISLLALSASYLIWNGGIYAIVAYAVVLFGLTLDKLMPSKKAILAMLAIMAIAGIIILHTSVGSLISGSSPISITTSETQPTPFFYYITGFMMAFFLMCFTLIGFHLQEREKMARRTYFAMSALLFLGLIFTIAQVRWNSLITIPVAVLGGGGFWVLYGLAEKYNLSSGKLNQMIFITTAVCIFFPTLQIISSGALPSVNTSYHNTMNWISNNTSNNATFLTFWQDGSGIEGWANRISYTDSVSGENAIRIKAFSDFLFQPAYNFTYLTTLKPDYLVVSKYWNEIGYPNSIAVEGNLSANSIVNGTNLQLLLEDYNTLTSTSIQLRKVYNESGSIIYEANYILGG